MVLNVAESSWRMRMQLAILRFDYKEIIRDAGESGFHAAKGAEAVLEGGSDGTREGEIQKELWTACSVDANLKGKQELSWPGKGRQG